MHLFQRHSLNTGIESEQLLKPEMKQNLLAVRFSSLLAISSYCGLLDVSFYLLVRAVLSIFVSFREFC